MTYLPLGDFGVAHGILLNQPHGADSGKYNNYEKYILIC